MGLGRGINSSPKPKSLLAEPCATRRSRVYSIYLTRPIQRVSLAVGALECGDRPLQIRHL
jgi:hypothetical protein